MDTLSRDNRLLAAVLKSSTIALTALLLSMNLTVQSATPPIEPEIIEHKVVYKEPLEVPVFEKHEPVDKIPSPKPKVAQTAPQAATADECESWMAEAGIPVNATTKKLIINESGCRPHVKNPSSGACGIPQAWPCSKLPCTLDENGAVCQLRWMDSYIKGRYGSWDGALRFWYAQCNTSKGCWY